MAGNSCSRSLFEISSEWFLDYCIYQLWKEFRDKRSFSDRWKDAVQDYLVNRPFDTGQELSNKLYCIRFIIGLDEHRQVDDHSNQESSSSSCSEDENKSGLLGCDCLKFFDKIAVIYPFSDVEKSHMKSTLKLQIVLSHYRHGDIKDAENVYSRLYSDNGDDEEYQDDIRELFQSENDTLKESFLRKHTYDRFLNQVLQFFTPTWKKFEMPILEEAPFKEESNEQRSRIDAKMLKSLYFAWDQSEEAEQNWTSVVEGTHPDITALKNRTIKKNIKDTTNNSKDKSPSTRQLQQVTRSRGEPTSSKKTSVSVNIEQCNEVMKNLKTSSRKLFSGLKDAYSDMVTGEAGPSVEDDNNDEDDDDSDNFAVRRHRKPVVAIPDSSRNGQKVDKKGKSPLERRPSKRRFNVHQSDAEVMDWSDSDDDDETDVNHKTIKLSSPARKRCLNIYLPANKRKFWTAKETQWLEEGVEAYGEGNWAEILNAYRFVGRTSVNLKDRWRNLQKK